MSVGPNDLGGFIQQPRRRYFELLRAQLDYEAGTFLSHWQDLGTNILPRRPRLNYTDVNRGDRRNTKIYDSTATLAARTLRSGMHGGISSPARPWMRLTTADPDMADFGPVKDWLHVVTSRMLTTFLKSNLYTSLPILYGDTGVFGTGAMSLEEGFPDPRTSDPHDILRTYVFGIGSYRLGNDERGRVNVFKREFMMTVRQIVGKFGKKDSSGKITDWSNISPFVKNLWSLGQTETWVVVIHVIDQNPEYRSGSPLSQFKKFRSVYYELGSSSAGNTNYLADNSGFDVFLSDKGYDYFPVLCPRWEVNGEDVYGTTCPGMDALGDVKGLQLMQKRKSQAIEKMVNPPMVGPERLRQMKSSIVPGDTTFLDEREGMKGFRPAHEVDPKIQELLLDIKAHQGRIDQCFYKDLFQMILDDDRNQRATATEISAKKEEQLVLLGPVLEQLNQDLHSPLIDITFQLMQRQGLVPEAPQEIQGQSLRIEFLSTMAQAQKLVGLQGVQTFTTYIENLAAIDQGVADKVDFDRLVEVVGDATGAPPGIVRAQDQVDQIRQQKQQAAAAAQQAQALQQGADAAQKLSNTDLSGNNALTALTQTATGGALA